MRSEFSFLENDESMNRLEEAVDLHQRGQTDEAICLYEKVLESEPDTFDAIRLLGIAHIQKGNAEEAIAFLEKARTLRPNAIGVQAHLGLALKLDGQLDEAGTCYRKVLETSPNDVNTIINLGNLLLMQDRGAEAAVFFQRGVELLPDDAACHVLLGDALTQIGYLDDAKNRYQKAIELDPENVNAHNGLGLLHLAKEELFEAIDSFKMALSFKPESAFVYNNLGQALQRQQCYEKAAEAFQKSIGYDPDLAAAHNNLGGALIEVEDIDKALACYKQALSLQPIFPESLLNQGIALFDSKNPALALTSFQAALTQAPNHPFAQVYHAVTSHLCDPTSPIPTYEDSLHADGKAVIDSYRYMAEKAPTAVPLSRSYEILKFAMEAATNEGLVLEFGVYFGHSIRYLATRVDGPVHGFDSFEGIPENWFETEETGAYSTNGTLPAVPDNVTLHVGWFDATLPTFRERHPGPVRLINIDCDIYASTKSVFDGIGDGLVPGSILVFDEYICYPQWREHEHKAFQEFVADGNWTYEYLAYSLFTRQTVVKLIERSSSP